METMTVLRLCLKSYENLWFWEVEEWETMTVLLLSLKTYEDPVFWEVEEHNAQVLDSPGLATMCWHKVGRLQGGCRASKPVLVKVRWHQGQETCAGAYKRQGICFLECKRRFCGKPVLVQARWHQGQQTCAGAYTCAGKVSFCLVGKRRFCRYLCCYRYGGTRFSKPVLAHTNGKVSFFWTAEGDFAANLC